MDEREVNPVGLTQGEEVEHLARQLARAQKMPISQARSQVRAELQSARANARPVPQLGPARPTFEDWLREARWPAQKPLAEARAAWERGEPAVARLPNPVPLEPPPGEKQRLVHLSSAELARYHTEANDAIAKNAHDPDARNAASHRACWALWVAKKRGVALDRSPRQPTAKERAATAKKTAPEARRAAGRRENPVDRQENPRGSDWRQLSRRLAGQGWRIEPTRKGHMKLLAPDGHCIVIVSGTPSDPRTLANLKADLRRCGFQDEARAGNPVVLHPNRKEWEGKSRGIALASLPQDELAKGAEHELEHSRSKLIARRTAADHLVEDPKYYTHLEAMESSRQHDVVVWSPGPTGPVASSRFKVEPAPMDQEIDVILRIARTTADGNILEISGPTVNKTVRVVNKDGRIGYEPVREKGQTMHAPTSRRGAKRKPTSTKRTGNPASAEPQFFSMQSLANPYVIEVRSGAGWTVWTADKLEYPNKAAAHKVAMKYDPSGENTAWRVVPSSKGRRSNPTPGLPSVRIRFYDLHVPSMYLDEIHFSVPEDFEPDYSIIHGDDTIVVGNLLRQERVPASIVEIERLDPQGRELQRVRYRWEPTGGTRGKQKIFDLRPMTGKLADLAKPLGDPRLDRFEREAREERKAKGRRGNPAEVCDSCGGSESNIVGCPACCRDCGFPCGFKKDSEGFHDETPAKKMTLAQAKKILAPLGLVISRTDPHENEWRVRFQGAKPGEGYFAGDLDDAVETGKAMAHQKTAGSAKSKKKSAPAKGSKSSKKADFHTTKTGRGGMILLEPMTAKAKAWTKKNLPGEHTYVGSAIVFDNQGMFVDVAEALMRDGLTLLEPSTGRVGTLEKLDRQGNPRSRGRKANPGHARSALTDDHALRPVRPGVAKTEVMAVHAGAAGNSYSVSENTSGKFVVMRAHPNGQITTVRGAYDTKADAEHLAAELRKGRTETDAKAIVQVAKHGKVLGGHLKRLGAAALKHGKVAGAAALKHGKVAGAAALKHGKAAAGKAHEHGKAAIAKAKAEHAKKKAAAKKGSAAKTKKSRQANPTNGPDWKGTRLTEADRKMIATILTKTLDASAPQEKALEIMRKQIVATSSTPAAGQQNLKTPLAHAVFNGALDAHWGMVRAFWEAQGHSLPMKRPSASEVAHVQSTGAMPNGKAVAGRQRAKKQAPESRAANPIRPWAY